MLANLTFFNSFLDVIVNSWPPVIASGQILHVTDSWMSFMNLLNKFASSDSRNNNSVAS